MAFFGTPQEYRNAIARTGAGTGDRDDIENTKRMARNMGSDGSDARAALRKAGIDF